MTVEKLEKRLKLYAQRLEEDPDYEMSDEMQEEYYRLKEDLEEAQNNPDLYENSDLPRLVQEFKQVSSQYENPDDINESMLKMMFPETDGEFDLDEWGDD